MRTHSISYVTAAIFAALAPLPLAADVVAELKLVFAGSSQTGSQIDVTAFKRGNDVRYNHAAGSTIKRATGGLVLLQHDAQSAIVLPAVEAPKGGGGKTAARNVYKTVVTDTGEARPMFGLSLIV